MVENKVYDILENRECLIDIYAWGTDDEVAEFLSTSPAVRTFHHMVGMWPNMEGGCAFFSWVENDGSLHSVGFDMIKNLVG